MAATPGPSHPHNLRYRPSAIAIGKRPICNPTSSSPDLRPHTLSAPLVADEDMPVPSVEPLSTAPPRRWFIGNPFKLARIVRSFPTFCSHTHTCRIYLMSSHQLRQVLLRVVPLPPPAYNHIASTLAATPDVLSTKCSLTTSTGCWGTRPTFHTVRLC